MQIEDIIYDAAVLKMGVCLERFLKRHPNVTPSYDVPDMIREFCKGDDKTRRWMREIWDDRKRVAHPLDERKKIAHPLDERTDAIFDFKRFQEIRQIGLELDKRLQKTTGDHTGMSEIMISSSLPYDMGNAGDLLKHGALATFVDWFLECGEQQIRYADPFGGRPWGYIFKEETRRRMEKLSSLPVIQHAQPDWRENSKYYGSSHVVRNVVRNVAEARDASADVLASDKDKLARSDLEASGISPIKDHDPENGFGILDKKHDDEQFDLILLDPFADFLLNEFGQRRETQTPHFESISKSVERNPGLCIMLFVLDMKDRSIHKQYAQQRKKYSGISFRLRCPRMERCTGVDGEASYNMDVLLISRQFAKRSDSVSKLEKRLRELRQALEEALPSQTRTGEIEFWPPG